MTKYQVIREVPVQLIDAEHAPAVAAYRMMDMCDRGLYHYTEDLEEAKRWADAKRGPIWLVKAWRLPNGMLALRNPAEASVAAVWPYVQP